MNVNLRLAHDKLLIHRVSVPCTGEMAKALGKFKLEEMLPGVLVNFVSYQEAEGKPEKALADNEPVLRWSILNFSANMDTVLQQQRLHHTLLKALYHDKVLTVMAKYSASFLKPPNDGSEKKQGVTNFFRSDPQTAAAAEAALVAVGSALSGSDFAAALDNMYYDRGKIQHINTSVQLEMEMKRLCEDGCIALLEDDMPVACTVIKHYDIFLALLP